MARFNEASVVYQRLGCAHEGEDKQVYLQVIPLQYWGSAIKVEGGGLGADGVKMVYICIISIIFYYHLPAVNYISIDYVLYSTMTLLTPLL